MEFEGNLRRPPATSPAPACDYRSCKAIGRMPDALVNQKCSFTNLYARDRLRCPYVVAAGIFCWVRSDSIPHTCVVSDPTSSDSLTSQFHLSNTYYKGRTTRWHLSRFLPTDQLCSLRRTGDSREGIPFFSLFERHD